MSKNIIHPALVASFALTLLIVLTLPAFAQAGSDTLPPRPSPPPTSVPEPSYVRAPNGGYIELRLKTTDAWIWNFGHWRELWTRVEWQDSLGKWHVVEGWQGTFDEFSDRGDYDLCEGKKTWWVAKADLDKGPFRWRVYKSPDGELVATSESFYLPDDQEETITVELPLIR